MKKITDEIKYFLIGMILLISPFLAVGIITGILIKLGIEPIIALLIGIFSLFSYFMGGIYRP